jgi:hypothetical protein
LPTFFDNDPKIMKKCQILIKMQLPFFTKKIKNVGNNVKMLTEIFCRLPLEKEVEKAKQEIKSEAKIIFFK